MAAEEEVDEEDAAMEAARERCAEPHLRDILRREQDAHLKGREPNIALEKWGPQIEAEIEAALVESAGDGS